MAGAIENDTAGAARNSEGRLEAVLKAGHFAVTAETTPPDTADAGAVLARVGGLKGVVDAVNVTDGAGARAHMSALAAAAIMARDGIEPTLQLTTRDRNRLALQADLLGAAALGIPNVLCLRGDDLSVGDQPEATPVHDLDSRALIATARQMRDEGTLPCGRRLESPPRLFLGAVDAPLDPPPEWRPEVLAAKVEAGVDFVQTQYCFDMGLLRRYLARLEQHGLIGRCHILVGIAPLASARSARWLNGNLPGVSIPDAVIGRLEGARDQAAEGVRICAELLQELREIEGVAGAHLMAPRQEEAIAQAVVDSGVLGARRAPE